MLRENALKFYRDQAFDIREIMDGDHMLYLDNCKW